MNRNQPKVEQVEMNEIATKASRVAESRTACLIDESLRIARNNNQDPFRTLAVSAYLQGVQDALTPPAEPELPVPVCKTCRGRGEVADYVGLEMRCVGVPCPDCSAAQPTTEQPRIWRMRDSQGVLHLRVFSSERTARRWANVAGGAVVYSPDNGETWIDEQAEREGE